MDFLKSLWCFWFYNHEFDAVIWTYTNRNRESVAAIGLQCQRCPKRKSIPVIDWHVKTLQ